LALERLRPGWVASSFRCMKRQWAAVVVAGTAIVVAALMFSLAGNRRERGLAPRRTSRVHAGTNATIAESSAVAHEVSADTGFSPLTEKSTEGSDLPAGKSPPPVRQVKQNGQKPKEQLQDPLARVALVLVGADADAEDYWFGAINDPSLPAHERQDLIEDLNEEGLSDPKNPGVEDVPLIMSRIELIEEAAPLAMDDVNRDAFLEAYKDLWNLLEIAMGGR